MYLPIKTDVFLSIIDWLLRGDIYRLTGINAFEKRKQKIYNTKRKDKRNKFQKLSQTMRLRKYLELCNNLLVTSI